MPAEQVRPPLVFLCMGQPVVSVKRLQREIAELRQQGPRRSSGSLSEELEGMYQGGYQAALADLSERLDLGEGN